MKLAESGKKTFFSFAQKVKDKIAELDQPSPGDGGSYDGSYAPPPMAQGSGRMFPQTAPPANPPAPAYQPPRGPPPVTHGYDVGPPSGPSVGLSAPVTSPPMAIPTPARPASASTSPSQITGLSTSPAPRASIDAGIYSFHTRGIVANPASSSPGYLAQASGLVDAAEQRD